MKIAVVGLVESENLGEQFIADSLIHIIIDVVNEHHFEQCTFVKVDLLARNDDIVKTILPSTPRKDIFYHYKNYGYVGEALYVVLRKKMQKMDNQATINRINRFRHKIWEHSINLKKRYMDYYHSKFHDVDLIVIDGAGLLEYSYNEYQEQLLLISEYAKAHGVSVVYNAIGRAGEFNPADFRCKILMSAIRSESVKYVSARDSAENVQQCVGTRRKVELLADAAFYLNEAYSVTKQEKTELIGIGLVRGTALQSYRNPFEEQDWIELFAGIALELKKRGYEFRFFTNGFHEDYELGIKVLRRLDLDLSYLEDRPTDAHVLLNTIASYRGIITCRMHSSIAAFSLGIPSVILNWNEKTKKYMNQLRYPERVVDPQYFDSTIIVDRLEKAMSEGVDDENRERMKRLARKSVEGYAELLSSK